MTCYPWRERRGNERNDQTSLAPACLFPSVRLIMDGPLSIAIARHLLQQTVCGIRTWFDEVLGICFDPEEGRLKAWWRLGLPNSAWLWGGEPRWAMAEDNQGLIVSDYDPRSSSCFMLVSLNWNYAIEQNAADSLVFVTPIYVQYLIMYIMHSN